MRVLVCTVVHNPADARILHRQIRALLDAGHEVTGIAASAPQAVKAALAERPDLVIMDIRLAGQGDGVEAAHEILSQTGIRCLFASAHSDAYTKSRTATAKPLGWLAKPYSRAEFLSALAAAIAQLDGGDA